MPDENNNNTADALGNNNSNNNAVVPDPNLPPELQGKSPAEIVAFYRQRESAYEDQIYDLNQRQQLPQHREPEMPAEPSTSDFYSNPAESVKKIAVTREEFQAATAAVQSNMIEMAVLLAARKLKDWDKWEPQIRSVMKNVSPHLQTDPVQWETAYTYVKGQQYDKDVQEAAVRGAQITSEIPSGIPPEPEMPAELNTQQKTVAAGLGLSSEKYQEGLKNLHHNHWPITFDSRRR